MHLDTLNWASILVATVAAFAIGACWYSPLLFGNTWMKLLNLTPEQINGRSKGRIFGFAFLWTLVMAFNLAMFLNDGKSDAAWGATAGFLAGFGWIAMGMFVTGLFEGKPTKLMLIDAGYMVVSLVVMGFIIGVWKK